MTEAMMFGYWIAPMAAVGGLFWNVARRLGNIETEVKQLRKDNARLESDLLAMRTLLSVLVDSRRATP